MSFATLLRRIILGRRPFILSHVEFKKRILTGEMAILLFIITAGYAVYDALVKVYAAIPFQLACALLAILSFFLNRSGRHTLAKIVLAVSSNITVYIFAASESHITEINIFFIVIAIATLAGFGYEQRYLAAGFLLLTFVLYLTTAFFDVKIVQGLSLDHTYLRENRIVNFFTGLVASTLIVFGLIAVNYHSEKALRENEALLARKNAELTRLNVELDRFVYSSSHDLIAPLRSILGLINLTNLTDDREEARKYMGLMKERVSELEKFIKEMKDYSKNASSAVKIEQIDLHKVIREVLETLRFYPGADRLAVHLEFGSNFILNTDHSRLKVILSNIISNCFKYSDLEKKQPYVNIRAVRDTQTVQIEISDNGVGIKEEALPKIFDMFFRAQEEGEGSGLGLYIVRETVNKLNGTIAVTSTVGEGTTFRIKLPADVVS